MKRSVNLVYWLAVGLLVAFIALGILLAVSVSA